MNALHALKRCTTCGTVYAFERGPKLLDAPKTCTRIVSASASLDISNDIVDVETTLCGGSLESVNV